MILISNFSLSDKEGSKITVPVPPISDGRFFQNYWFQFNGIKETENKPCLLLVHGFGGNHTRLQVVWDHFTKLGYPIFRIDLKGHGYSKKSGEKTDYKNNAVTYSLKTAADEISSFIKEKIVTEYGFKSIAIIAHSMGGIISQLIAQKAPEFLTHLILVATVSEVNDSYRNLTGFMWTIFPMVKKAFFSRQRRSHSEAGIENFPEWSEKNRELMPDTTALRYYMRALSKVNITEENKKIRAKTLIIGGSDDDFATPVLLKILSDSIPNSMLLVFDNTKHYPYLTHTERFLKEIGSFLYE